MRQMLALGELLTACDHLDEANEEAALHTRMSSCHILLSKGRDSLNFSINGSVAPVNLPPHSFLVLAAPSVC